MSKDEENADAMDTNDNSVSIWFALFLTIFPTKFHKQMKQKQKFEIFCCSLKIELLLIFSRMV